MMSRHDAGAGEIAVIDEGDPMLTASVLRAPSSVARAPLSPIRAANDEIVRIGFSMTRRIDTCAALRRAFSNLSRSAECPYIRHSDETFEVDALHVQGPEKVRDEERRRRQLLLNGMPRLVSPNLPEHTRRRGVVSKAFAYRSRQEHRPFIERAVDSLLDSVAPGEPFDLFATFARPPPRMLLGELLGVPSEDRGTIVDGARAVLWATNPFSSREQQRLGRQARDAISDCLDRIIEGRVAPEDGEVLPRMVEAERSGELSRESCCHWPWSSVPRGTCGGELVTTNGMHALLQHPDRMTLLRIQSELIPDAVDKLMRYDVPVQSFPKVAAVGTVGASMTPCMSGMARHRPASEQGRDGSRARNHRYCERDLLAL